MIIIAIIWKFISNNFGMNVCQKCHVIKCTRNKPRTAEIGTFQAYLQVHQFVAMDLHPAEQFIKLLFLNRFS